MKEKKIIKLKVVEQLGKLQCTAREAAAFLDIRISTFNSLLSTEEVRTAWDKGKNLGFISLRRKQMRLAANNAPMAIFLGKQYLSQRDVSVHELTGEDGGPIEYDLGKLNGKERSELRTLIDRSLRSKDGSK